MCLETKSKEMALDSIFESFADEHRRLVVQYLHDATDGVASYDDLVEYVSKHCTDTRDREKVKIRLHHVSLPTLEKADIIECDSRSKTVRYRPASVVNCLAEFIEDIED